MRQAVEPAYFVPESVKADVLFRNMKAGGHTMAVVLDEYGGMTGVVTLNDLVEQLVGDLGEEEMGRNPLADIENIAPGVWQIRGETPLDDVAEALGVALPCEMYDTFNGLVFGALGAIPEDGATPRIRTAGLDIQVTELLGHQVERAEVRLDRQDSAEQAVGS